MVYNLTENGLVEAFNCVLKFGIQSFTHDWLSWEDGIEEPLKMYRATPPKPGTPSPVEQFYQHTFRLDFQPVWSLDVQRLPSSSGDVLHAYLRQLPISLGGAQPLASGLK